MRPCERQTVGSYRFLKLNQCMGSLSQDLHWIVLQTWVTGITILHGRFCCTWHLALGLYSEYCNIFMSLSVYIVLVIVITFLSSLFFLQILPHHTPFCSSSNSWCLYFFINISKYSILGPYSVTCMFSELSILHQTTSWCALLWEGLPLPLPVSLTCMWFLSALGLVSKQGGEWD